ncbi:hypothetical protein ESCO_001597 [Escovopsis weberi]|uniref:Uncharacterized protein n=1 Tax=Escovopsis weberi TaxID=150374 RepID=A0A0M9VWR6_ESCWE|nr:hypothetical protein ESCO_001597 [Escovopsis weberi]
MNHLLSGMDASASVSGAFAVAGAAPPQPSTHLIQRLSQQNILIRDAWEAERNYLEANRRRAEEVYQEERAIMEDLRDVWSHEKLELLQAMQLLRERIQRLEGENTALKAMVSQSMPSVTGVLSPLASQRGDSANGSASHSLSGSPVPANGTASSVQQGSSQKHANFNSSASVISASLPPGLDGASRRPHFASPPKQQPSPPLVMDPRTQPETSPAHDFLAAPSNEAEAPVAVIDVQEIDPKLEGISLKATAIQKPTFSQEIAKSPPVATSPEAGSHHEDDGELSESQQLGAAPSPPPEPEEYLLAAADDAPEGPLMVKNIPAQDELFWAAVNKKLEPISQGQDALPTVMQTPPAELDLSKWPDVLAVVGGGDANRTARAGDQDDDDLDDELDSSGKKASQEIDIPLKLRTTTNFGAPFGRM